MKQKGFLSLQLIIPLVLLLLGGIFLFNHSKSTETKSGQLQPRTTDPTRPTPFPSPWDKIETLPDGTKQYTSVKDNYQFDLPKSWVDKTDQQNLFSISDKPKKDKDTYDYDPSSLTMSKYSDEKTEDALNRDNQLFDDAPKIKIDGFEATRIVSKPKAEAEPDYSIVYTIKKERKLYYDVIFRSGEKSAIDKNLKNISFIMDSFKFLNKADRQITLIHYSNPDLGYSFDYPSNWLVNTFQNNGDYNQGITVVNDDDSEVLSLHYESKYDSCPPADYYGKDYKYPEADVLIGNVKSHLKQDCNNPDIQTSKGNLFRLSAAVYGKDYGFYENPDPKLLDLLKSMQGIEVIR